jgi:hypothetical protein
MAYGSNGIEIYTLDRLIPNSVVWANTSEPAPYKTISRKNKAIFLLRYSSLVVIDLRKI